MVCADLGGRQIVVTPSTQPGGNPSVVIQQQPHQSMAIPQMYSGSAFPVHGSCPFCQELVTSLIDHKVGALSWVWAAGLTLLGYVMTSRTVRSSNVANSSNLTKMTWQSEQFSVILGNHSKRN